MGALQTLSLRSRLLLLVGLLLGAASLFILVFFPTRMKSISGAAMDRRASGMATVLASAVAPGLEANDRSVVSDILAGLAAGGDVKYAAVYRADGTALAQLNPQDLPPTDQDSLRPHMALVGGVLHVVAKVNARTGPGGALAIGFSLQELEREGRAHLWIGALISGLMFALGLGAVYAIGTYLVLPLRRLTEVAGRIASGEVRDAERALGGAEAVELLAAAAANPTQDEVQQLSSSFARMLRMLKRTSTTLRNSASMLTESVGNLRQSSSEQTTTVRNQAIALQHTQEVTEDLQRASTSAADEARRTVEAAEGADRVSRAGEGMIETSLTKLSEIRAEVQAISAAINHLRERTNAVGEVTETVKDLADQSYILALNGAIEAARSGEQGAGFEVVAGNMRKLSDQSIQRTREVQRIVDDIVKAIQKAVFITQSGSEKVEGSLGEVRASGEQMRHLSTIVNESGAAVRQVATAVAQQDAGIQRILTDVHSLSEMMEATLLRLHRTDAAITIVEQVSSLVEEVAGNFKA